MEIQGYPDYLIYEDGRVWGKKTQGRKEGFMKSKPNHDRYLRIRLTNENGHGGFLIHRLIALHYIPNPENKPEVDHIDRNKLNNDVTNLRWATISENGQNTAIYNTNISGIKNVFYANKKQHWTYRKTTDGNLFIRRNKNKNIVLWIKFYDYIILKYNIY